MDIIFRSDRMRLSSGSRERFRTEEKNEEITGNY